jgi:type IV pilus assembly protein PilF
MSRQPNIIASSLPPRLLVPGVLVLLTLAACAATPQKTSRPHEAAADNVQLGLRYMEQGNLQLAKIKLDLALKQDPGSADVHSARGTLFARLGDPAKADEEFRTALHEAPHDPDVQNNYGAYLCENGHTDEGVKRFLEAAHNALYRTPQAAYVNAGVCLRTAKRYEQATANFNQALALQPNYGEAAFQLATLEFERGDLSAARTRIDTFVGTYDATPDLLLLGVRVTRALHDPVAAQRYARRLQLDFPGSEQARALASLNNPG